MNPSNLKISIVTPSFNQAPFIAEAIESVHSQNYPRMEHIIFDNCSADGTAGILRKYPHLDWACEPDQGQSDALNKGFKKAKGDIIGWLNADDIYLKDCFSRVAEFFANNPAVDIAYGDFYFIDQKGSVIQKRRELGFDLFMLKYLHVLYIPSTALFFRRKIFDEGNFIDTRYHYAMDYEFFLRLALKGYVFSHLQGFLAGFRWHEQSKSSLFIEKQRSEHAKALLTHDTFLNIFPVFLKDTLRMILMACARLKRCCLKAAKGYYFDQWTEKSDRA